MQFTFHGERQVSCLGASSDSLAGAAHSRLSAPISQAEPCQMPQQMCPGLQKSCLSICVLEGDVLRKVGEKSTAEEALENKL